ncbi:ICEBs1 excisionase [Listeria rustica]|uniref:ICEBs1 excisionase n=1 Tax=Listeria rustica TaxID=2713503 RepID=A0A7W1T562_9LIST|nr:ICEBs1 excisionase [Listeria rustica]MBA3925521.1 ICEBs1 excisionase [Listeria rustica]
MDFLNAKQVAELLQVSESYAYVEIRELNAEMKQQGYRVKRGRVNKTFFEKAYGFSSTQENGVVEHDLQAN